MPKKSSSSNPTPTKPRVTLNNLNKIGSLNIALEIIKHQRNYIKKNQGQGLVLVTQPNQIDIFGTSRERFFLSQDQSTSILDLLENNTKKELISLGVEI